MFAVAQKCHLLSWIFLKPFKLQKVPFQTDA